jgi:hypothetical protein
MLYLKHPTKAVLDDYSEKLALQVLGKVNNPAITINNASRGHLTLEKIKEILISKPDELIGLHLEVMPILIPGFNEAEYINYIEAKRSNNIPVNLQQYKEVDKLLKVFDYEQFISGSKPRAYDLSLGLNRNTCTYCNRLYTNTVQYKDPVTRRVNNTTRITRPQFDHWYAHSIFPVLGLSFYNLIPSCSVCNSSVKGDDMYSLTTHIHPYVFETGQNFKFSYSQRGNGSYAVEILVNPGTKISKFLTEMKMKEVYDAHADLELKDLIDLKKKYSENYLDTLFNETLNNFQISKTEINRMIFGIEVEEDKYHMRTFSKFKADILAELMSID